MGTLGPLELILIFLVVLLIFGAKRIPEIARGVGKGIREFKDATNEISREFDVEDRRQRIEQPRQPQHGASQPRSTAQPAADEEAPSSPTRSDTPGDASESAHEQQAS